MNGGKLVIETELDTKSFDAQIEETRKKLELLEKSADESNVPKQFRRSAAETRKLNAEIEKTRNTLIGLQTQQAKLNNVTEKTANTTTIGFSKGLKTLKRFALGIIGIRSAYMAARKAASSYMAQDEELSNKMQSFWVGLGSFLAPVLEMLSNAMLKALGYLNVFIKALTGVDYIARANAKALQKQTKATKEATNALSSLDEIENINLGDKLGGFDSSLEAPMIEIPELDENIVKKLQDLAKWLQENWDWIWKVGAALAGVFLVSKLAGVLSGIGALIGSAAAGTGLAALAGLLAVVAAVWTTVLVIKGLQDLQEWADLQKKILDNQKKLVKSEGEVSSKLMKNMEKVIDMYGKEAEATEEGKKAYDNIVSSIVGEIDSLEKLAKDMNYTKEQQDAFATSADYLRKYMVELNNQGTFTKQTWKEYTQAVGITSTELEKLSKKTNYTKEDIKTMAAAVRDGKIALKDIANADYRVKIKTEMDNQAIDKLERTIEALETMSDGSFNAFGFKIPNQWLLSVVKNKLRQIRGYAYGGLVTQPTRALIGEAGYNEYVVPERSDYLSRLANNIIENMPQGSGSGITDDLLLDLNRNISELASRPIILNVDGKTLAEATFKDFQNESNRLNNSTSILIK